MRRTIATVVLTAAALPQLGCVFNDIHDQLVLNRRTVLETNARLVEINESLGEVETGLNETNTALGNIRQELEQVQRTNDLLIELQAGLGAEAAGAQGRNRETIIGTMELIGVSLENMDQHLSSLRRTLENIDSTIPFLKFADPADDEAFEIDEETGLPIDPETGHLIDEEQGMLIDRETGQIVGPYVPPTPDEGAESDSEGASSDGSDTPG